MDERGVDLRREWTEELENRYLGALAVSGHELMARDAVGLCESTVIQRRRSHAEFDRKCDEAVERYRCIIEKEIHRRAIEGVPRGRYYQDKKLCDEKQYSDTLLLALARRWISGYRDRPFDVNVGQGGVLVVNAPSANVEEWEKKFGAEE